MAVSILNINLIAYIPFVIFIIIAFRSYREVSKASDSHSRPCTLQAIYMHTYNTLL